MFYGRKGFFVVVIFVIDFVFWDLFGKICGEFVYKFIGGNIKDCIDFYCIGLDFLVVKKMGFWGVKVFFFYCFEEGYVGFKKNVEFFCKYCELVGLDFFLMVDCYMLLNVFYMIEIVKVCEDLNINWWEECFSFDDMDGFKQIKCVYLIIKFIMGEYEYLWYGFCKLIEGRNLDIIQLDVMWFGGMMELFRVVVMVLVYDIFVVFYVSGLYSYYFVISQFNIFFQEYLVNLFDGKSVLFVFGDLFVDELIFINGFLMVVDLDKLGFGLMLNLVVRVKLILSIYLLVIFINLLFLLVSEEKKEVNGVNGCYVEGQLFGKVKV